MFRCGLSRSEDFSAVDRRFISLAAQLAESFHGVSVLGVQFGRLRVARDRMLLVPVLGVGLAEIVMSVRRVEIHTSDQLEYFNRLSIVSPSQQIVPQRVEHGLIIGIARFEGGGTRECFYSASVIAATQKCFAETVMSSPRRRMLVGASVYETRKRRDSESLPLYGRWFWQVEPISPNSGSLKLVRMRVWRCSRPPTRLRQCSHAKLVHLPPMRLR